MQSAVVEPLRYPPRLYHLNTHCKQGDSRKKQLTGAERLDALVSKLNEKKARLKTRRDKSDKASTMYQLSCVVESLEGEELFAVHYWPDSPKSADAAVAAVMDFCERHKVHIVEENGYDVSEMYPNYA